MTTATHILKTRVTADTKQIIESIARQQQLTESAWLRRLISSTLQSAGAAPSGTAEAEVPEESPRAARLMIRLVPEDQLLLQARAAARGMLVKPFTCGGKAELRTTLRRPVGYRRITVSASRVP